MTRAKMCPARAVIFINGEKTKARCIHREDYHSDQDEFQRSLTVVPLPHQIRYADGLKVTWARDGEILWVDSADMVTELDAPAGSERE